MVKNWQPTTDKNRLESIDIVRGFAIFGIFIVNIGAFSAPYFLYGHAEEVWTNPVDQVTLALIDILFQGSFYPLFAILFGFSWQLMYERTIQKEREPFPFLFRRQVLLIVFGAIHGFFLWHGDILFTYGFVGLLLFLFIQVNHRTLLGWSIFILVGSTMFLTISLFSVRTFIEGNSNDDMIRQAIINYSSGDLTAIWTQNLQDWINSNGGIAFLFLILMILPLFLIGVYLARKRLFHEPDKHRPKLKKLLIGSFIVFIIFKAGPYLFGNPLWMSYLQDQIGGTASALFYFTGIVLFLETTLGKKCFRPLKYVGRMALSNYLLQSIFCFILFYGFGFYHWVGPLQSVLIVIGFYILQISISKWWLKRFRFGPFEWLLRSLNYRTFQPIRRD